MKNNTNARNINGSWYLRIPPGFAEHLELKGTSGTSIEMEILDEHKTKGKFISSWKKTD